MPPPVACDVLIVGGGHNGLTCACYLAAAGLKVRVIERRSVVGGAAVTEEFHPGFRNSTASYTVSLLNPQVIRDLRLAEHGLRILERPIANFLPLSDTDYLKVGGSLAATQAEVDELWEKLLAGGGTESQCGWLKDRFGVSWQIIPSILGKLMSEPEKAQRVVQAFMKMKKMDIETLVKA